MKKILVPTDFSEASESALDYAAEIARLTTAKIILLHVYTIPVLLADPILSIPPFEGLEEDYMKLLQEKSSRLRSKKGKNLEIDCIYREGDIEAEIAGVAEQEDIDLIVMGIRQKDFLTEKIIGSITTSLLMRATCPVLAIPKELKFTKVKRIVFASDFLKTDSEILKPLKVFVQLFHAEVYILNVVQSLLNVSDTEEALNALDIHQKLKEVRHFFHDVHADDIVEGINKFIREYEIDMVVMIPRKHSRFVNFFREPRTKKLAFHASVPLLALHAPIHSKIKPVMKSIAINDEISIRSIQDAFNSIFPYLKLEFYSKQHAPGRPSNVKFLQQPGKLLGEIRKNHTNGEIIITPEMTVSDVEQLFGDEYGIGVQVFRKSGNVWLETTITDNWTLQKQNAEGEFLSTPVPRDEPTDYKEQE